MTSLVYEVEPIAAGKAKRHGLYNYSGMTEYQIGLIAAAGVLANLVLAVVCYILNFPIISRYSIYFAFFHLIPISDLDGMKILFGEKLIWITLVIIEVIALAYALILI